MEKVYCVRINHETFEVDEAETKRMRAERIKERLNKGIPGREYVQDMVEKRKNKDVPEIVAAFLEEIAGFSEGFREELAFEEKFATEPEKVYPPEAGEELFKLTPKVNVLKTDSGKTV